MAILEHLEPKSVFRFFEELCAIPHGSGNTRQVSDWLMDFARQRGLEAHQDALGNVVIIREATPGYESAGAVIVQGHMDMVCEQAPDCTKDMAAEGLDLAVEGDTVYARGTTLGGDDGIAVAMALALLDADDIPHPRLEAVITVDEETGMLGAVGMEDVSMLKGRRMLNIDSEVEGVFTVSCAGGNMTCCTLPVTRAPFGAETLAITVGGLRGGHSGIEIHKGLGNACTILGRVLTACAKATPLRVTAVSGGLKANAIPREATALVSVDDYREIRAVCDRLDEALKNEFRATDPEVFVSVRAVEPSGTPMDEACGEPEADAGGASGVPAGGSGRQRGSVRGLHRLGIPPRLPPAGADGGGVHGAVRPRPHGGGHPRRRGVRHLCREAARPGLHLLRP